MIIRKIGLLGRTYRHIHRYRQILTVLFKYGFGELVDSLKIEQYIEVGVHLLSRKHGAEIKNMSRAQRIKLVLEELGPTFVKMGQLLSTRPDLLPPDIIQELVKLQDDVPPFPFTDVKHTIETELRKPLDEVFDSFDENPVAAASIGQVHRARLACGDTVAVKVQRKNIRRTIETDMEILLHIATMLESHVEGWSFYRPTSVVQELARSIGKELDYTVESAHIERFARQFEADNTVYVPKVYREVTTSRVLTMEYIDGSKVDDIDRLVEMGFDPVEIARRGADLIMKQIFVHGFFHADPHGGNILVLPDNVICYIDFGMMGRVNRQNRENFVALVTGIVNRDETKTTSALLKLMVYTSKPDRHALENDVAEFIDQHFYRPIKELEFAKVLRQLLTTTAKHGLRIPPNLFLMLKAFSTVEALGRALDPDFDITERAAPFVRHIHMARFSPNQIRRDVIDSGTELVNLIKVIPSELRALLEQARLGKIRIEFEHRGLDPLLVTHDRISNRLAFAIVLASLIIGSSLIVLSGVPPKWNEIPIIGLVGFVVAGAMGFWLLISMLRHGKM